MPGLKKIDTLQKAALSYEGRFEGKALICQDREISFAEFDHITHHIANVLAMRGIGPSSVVELSMKRSEKMMMAMIGVFKSGAVLLPVNLNLPQKRKDLIHKEQHIDLFLTDNEYDAILAAKEQKSTELVMASPLDTALILYTSGSTGKPKGVLHSQSSKLFSREQYPIHISQTGIKCNKIDNIVAKTNITFVSSYIFELLPAITNGITMVVLTDDEQNDVKAVGRAISEYENTSVFMTPSQTQNFLRDENFRAQFKKLGNLVVAGEKLKPEARDVILENADENTAIINAYGSSECHLITAGDVRSLDYPYTNVLPGVELKVVSENKTECEAGSGGEIVLKSPYTLTGYTNSDMRISKLAGQSYFATGDEGVLSEDGKVWIKGRIDRMIKLHGLRIEPGDIESNLCEYPRIRDCAVVVGKTEAGIEALVAYYVSDEDLDSGDIRQFLTHHISEAMIPIGFIRLENLPLNPNGKIDYPLLSEKIFVPDNEGSAEYSDTITSKEEELICQVLSGILEGKDITPASNLFRLGVDSLIAFQMIGVFKEKGYVVSISDIFSHPVIGDLAKVIRKEEATQSQDETEITQFAATGPQIYWGTEITPEKKMRGMYVTNNFVCDVAYDDASFKKRVDLIVKKHPAIRMSIVFREDGTPGQEIRDEANTLVEFHNILDRGDGVSGPFEPSKEQMEYIENTGRDIYGRILENEEVIDLQAACFKISDRASFIMITGNHISIDGTSMNVLMQEFSAKELDDGRDSYIDFLKYISSPNSMQQAIGFFGGYLHNAELSALPENEEAKTEDGSDPEPDFRSIPFRLGSQETQKLDEISRDIGISTVGHIIYMYGQALLNVLGKEAVIMQMLTFGRGVPVSGIESSVGCFIETIPVVIRKSDTPVQFQAGYLQAEQFSYLLSLILWKTALGLDEPPTLAPFLISEIFPPVKTAGYFKEFADRDYEHMVMSNFIVKEDGNYSFYLHFDAAKIKEDSFTELSDEFIRILKENCK